jgi:microcystin-dependent protein
MADQYVGEIRMVGFNFPPNGWALCNGQLMSITQNTALFSLLGNNYGGDGKSTFGLPNLQASAPMGYGNGNGLSQRYWGEIGGEYAVTLQLKQMSVHNHGVNCMDGKGSADSPANAVWASAKGDRVSPPLYAVAGTNVLMNTADLQPTGGTQPHNNMPPFLAVYFVIALQGIFPKRN